MRVMNCLFSNILDLGFGIFLDDILIYSEDAATHFDFLRRSWIDYSNSNSIAS